MAYRRIERVGKVSIYKRGTTYSVYYREHGESVRRPVDGNLTTARATASRINAALLEGRPAAHIFTAEEEHAFFDACDEWQKPIFTLLAAYGLRLGELTHLLIEDVDLKTGTIEIRSKPELCWMIKSRRRRSLPLIPEIRKLLAERIGKRRCGFVFVHRDFLVGERDAAITFRHDRALRAHCESLADAVREEQPDAGEKDVLRVVRRFCRSIGQIPHAKRGRIVRYRRDQLDAWLQAGACKGRLTVADPAGSRANRWESQRMTTPLALPRQPYMPPLVRRLEAAAREYVGHSVESLVEELCRVIARFVPLPISLSVARDWMYGQTSEL